MAFLLAPTVFGAFEGIETAGRFCERLGAAFFLNIMRGAQNVSFQQLVGNFLLSMKMLERRTGRRYDAMRARYRRALEACFRVAAEELQVATVALRDAESLGERLRTSVSSIVERSGPSGAAIEDTCARLREVQVRLEGAIVSSIASPPP